MICERCGHSMPDGSLTCENCGTYLGRYGGSAFQGQNIGQKGIFLNKVQYLGKTTDLFESVSYET